MLPPSSNKNKKNDPVYEKNKHLKAAAEKFYGDTVPEIPKGRGVAGDVVPADFYTNKIKDIF
jgi:hypothetical protein